jgi:hypothetical protein
VEITDIAIPAMSAAGGATVTGIALKMAIQSWFKRHDEVASLVQTMLIQMTRIEERVSSLQRTEERARQQDTILAVVQSQLSELRDDLNGVGRKVREIQTQ